MIAARRRPAGFHLPQGTTPQVPMRNGYCVGMMRTPLISLRPHKGRGTKPALSLPLGAGFILRAPLARRNFDGWIPRDGALAAVGCRAGGAR